MYHMYINISNFSLLDCLTHFAHLPIFNYWLSLTLANYGPLLAIQDFIPFRKAYKVSRNTGLCLNITIPWNHFAQYTMAKRFSIDLTKTYASPKVIVHSIPVIVYIEEADRKYHFEVAYVSCTTFMQHLICCI